MCINKRFSSLALIYTENKTLVSEFWKEIATHYNSPRRYYHNLNHIKELLQYFDEYQDKIRKKEVVLFSIFYHDIIYDVKRKDNEEKSAELAEKRLNKLKVPKQDIDICVAYIVATKSHENLLSDTDLVYFLDFDMAVLGKKPDEYIAYTEQIRKEYQIFPGFMYRKGRKKALESFLQKERIYLSDDFYHRFEKQARANIENELKMY